MLDICSVYVYFSLAKSRLNDGCWGICLANKVVQWLTKVKYVGVVEHSKLTDCCQK